jgi:ribosomal protein S18 acetylase RimI-like enzyme
LVDEILCGKGQPVSSLIVREINPSDVHRLIELGRRLFAREEAAFGFDAESLRKELAEYRFVRFIGRLNGRPDREFFVGEIGGLAVGTTMVHRLGDAWYVSAVMVDAEYQRRGIARQLLERACRRAQQLGAKRVILHVRSDNEAAKTLYSSLGFKDFEHDLVYVRSSEKLDGTPLPEGYEIKKIDRFDKRSLAFADACREPASDAVYGATIPPPLLMRLYWRLFFDQRLERFVIASGNEWVGLYSFRAASKKEAAFLRLSIRKDRRGMIELPLVKRALQQSYEFGAPRLSLRFNAHREELLRTCDTLGFGKVFETDGMVKDLSTSTESR